MTDDLARGLASALLACMAGAWAGQVDAQCSTGVVMLELDAGTSGATLRTPDGAPVVGGPFSLQYDGELADFAGVVFYSPFEAPVFDPVFQATVYTGTPLFYRLFLTNVFGDSKKLFKVGALDASLCGVEVVFQAGLFEPGAPGGLSITNAVRMRVGHPSLEVFLRPARTEDAGGVDVAVADLGGDGIDDLVTADATTDLLRVFQGRPEGGYVFVSAQPAGDSIQSVDLGDLTGDGLVDAVVSSRLSDEIHVFSGNGTGGFSPGPAIHAAPEQDPYRTALGDFDGDGELDVVTAHRFHDDVYWMQNLGAGALAPGVLVAAGKRPVDVVAADMDDDGALDLVVPGTVDDAVAVVLGNGDGTFAAPVVTSVGVNAFALAVADWNADDVLDVMLTSDADDVMYLAGDGAGGLTLVAQYDLEVDPTDIAAADLDGDGALDAAIVNAQSGSLSVLLGDGQGGFALRHWTAEFRNLALAVTDATADGDPDVVLTTSNGLSTAFAVVEGRGDGTFAAVERFPGGVPSSSGAIVAPRLRDLDGDGRADWITARSDFGLPTALPGELVVRLTTSDAKPGPESVYPVGIGPVAVAVLDLDLDGHPDAVTANSGFDVSVLLGDGTGAFLPAGMYNVGTKPERLFVADVDGDGDGDLVVDSSVLDRIAVLRNPGNGTLSPFVHYLNAGMIAPDALSIADFDGDGFLDLATANSVGESVLARLNDTTGSFGGTLATPFVGIVGVPGAADLDQDGNDDLAVQTASRIAALTSDGDGTFTATGFDETLQAFIAFADVDGDGNVDLMAHRATPSATLTYLGDGAGGLGPVITLGNALGTKHRFVEDFDGDGILDYLSESTSSARALLLHTGLGTGAFAPVRAVPSGGAQFPSEPAEMAVGDIDGDGMLDVAYEREDVLSYFVNQSGEAELEPCSIANKGVVGVGESKLFDGTPSALLGAAITSYAWDLGDGTLASGPLVSHTYAATGAYSVSLVTTDSLGGVHTCAFQQVVTEVPTCALDLVAGFFDVAVDASGSSDPDGTIVSYQWDMGDGTILGPSPSATAMHTYASPGTFAITQTIVDSDGFVATCATQVTVPATAPQCTFDAAPAGGLQVVVNALASSDPDGTIVDYGWDFGDGTVVSAPSLTSHTFAASGTYTITLTLTDDSGEMSSCSQEVEVP